MVDTNKRGHDLSFLTHEVSALEKDSELHKTRWSVVHEVDAQMVNCND